MRVLGVLGLGAALCSSLVPHAGAVPTLAPPRGAPSPDIPLSDPRLVRTSKVEQVHLTGGAPDAVMVTWVTNETSLSAVTYAENGSAAWKSAAGSSKVYSTLMDPRFPATEGGCIGSKNYTNPGCFYTSGDIHTVELQGLTPGTKYEYCLGAQQSCAVGARLFHFATPPAVGPKARMNIAIVGDLGQTGNSSATVDLMTARVAAGEVDLILHAGDLSYADGNGYRWDAYARMGEKLWSAIPTAHVGGNHEISNGGENWLAYSQRYPNPHLRSGSDSFLWYSFEAGPAHVIMLCSYADYSINSIQRKWLEADLAKVDRTKTPWLLAMWHTPWYTSNHHHPMAEGAQMRESMEGLLHDAKVDAVFNGHVHSYERTKPVYNLEVAKGGIPYIVIGDGGNREGFALPWNVPAPAWSALREDAYGYGELTLSETKADWKWIRIEDHYNPNPGGEGDSVTLTK